MHSYINIILCSNYFSTWAYTSSLTIISYQWVWKWTWTHTQMGVRKWNWITKKSLEIHRVYGTYKNQDCSSTISMRAERCKNGVWYIYASLSLSSSKGFTWGHTPITSWELRIYRTHKMYCVYNKNSSSFHGPNSSIILCQ